MGLPVQSGFSRCSLVFAARERKTEVFMKARNAGLLAAVFTALCDRCRRSGASYGYPAEERQHHGMGRSGPDGRAR
jgi:hypothetical protein